jgi:hypothetical protein
MRKTVALLAFAALMVSTGCTVFSDDIYRFQAGYNGSSSFDNVEQAIHDEFESRFGDAVFRADIEWKYNHWTAISNERAIGLEKYRMRVSAYPQLDQDGQYEAVVIARQEVYTGSSYGMGRGGPTAMYSSKWTETMRDRDLEADLSNAIHARMRAANAGGQ